MTVETRTSIIKICCNLHLTKMDQKCDEGVIEKLKLKSFLDLSVSEKWACSCQTYCISGLVIQLMSGKKLFKMTLTMSQIQHSNQRQSLKLMTVETRTSIIKICCNLHLTKMYLKMWSGCYWKTQTKIFSWFIGFWKMDLQLSDILHPWVGNSINVWPKSCSKWHWRCRRFNIATKDKVLN